MFETIFRKIFREEVDIARELAKQTMLDSIAHVYQLDPQSQYMIVVPDQETARQLADEMARRFDPSSRIVIVAADEVNLIELKRRG